MNIIKIIIKLLQTKTVDKYSHVRQSEKNHNSISDFGIVYTSCDFYFKTNSNQ